MEEKIRATITLGYGGHAILNISGGKGEDNCWVMMVSANLSKTINVPSYIGYNMDLDEENIPSTRRNDVALGSGLIGFNGSISFNLTQGALDKLFSMDFVNRFNVFDLTINDGKEELYLPCCYWNSFNLSASPRSVLTGTISFVSTNNQNKDFQIKTENFEHYRGFSEKLVEYWNTGSDGLESFDISFSREAIPVYLNTDSDLPTYIRCGKVMLNCNFTSWKDWFEVKRIRISNKKLMFYGEDVRESKNFSFQGTNNTGLHSYSIRLYNLEKSSDIAWAIENI